MATIGLGMPSIDIVFKEAGIQAIRRGKQGVVALILKDAATVSPHRLINIKISQKNYLILIKTK